MKKNLQYLPETVEFIKQNFPNDVNTAIILGTGLNEIAKNLQIEAEIPYQKIPHFRTSTAPSHRGRLLFGKMAGKNILIMQGRLHCYEGYSSLEVTYPLFALKKIGVKNLIITNAAGSLNENFNVGDLVLISDHINLTGKNPLIGENDEKFGLRFPSMNDAYHKNFIKIAKKVAKENSLDIKVGIYAGLLGPNMETRAECKMLKTVGADMIGLSTVHEVIVAVYLQMKILGISTITNMSNLFHSQIHSQKEIEKAAKSAQNKLIIFLNNFLKNL
ncbi:MAG: purine-nucleoside phosphorylase [Candidatus Cloacimonetes bacterium]|nr:purine-nucleoside phosphorylase [Candidatus Cloacimonadota bacterium]